MFTIHCEKKTEIRYSFTPSRQLIGVAHYGEPSKSTEIDYFVISLYKAFDEKSIIRTKEEKNLLSLLTSVSKTFGM